MKLKLQNNIPWIVGDVATISHDITPRSQKELQLEYLTTKDMKQLEPVKFSNLAEFKRAIKVGVFVDSGGSYGPFGLRRVSKVTATYFECKTDRNGVTVDSRLYFPQAKATKIDNDITLLIHNEDEIPTMFYQLFTSSTEWIAYQEGQREAKENEVARFLGAGHITGTIK